MNHPTLPVAPGKYVVYVLMLENRWTYPCFEIQCPMTKGEVLELLKSKFTDVIDIHDLVAVNCERKSEFILGDPLVPTELPWFTVSLDCTTSVSYTFTVQSRNEQEAAGTAKNMLDGDAVMKELRSKDFYSVEEVYVDDATLSAVEDAKKQRSWRLESQ
jgi:hypothetical protein